LDYEEIFQRVIVDARYLQNLDWGEPRPGHPEGTVRAHIAEIEPNLERLKPQLSESEYWKLKLLIHTHDSFKAAAKENVAISDPATRAFVSCRVLWRCRPASDGAISRRAVRTLATIHEQRELQQTAI
jgi:hypothetical protein